MLPDPVAPARHDDDFPLPVVLVLDEVVERSAVQPAVGRAQEGEGGEREEGPEDLQRVPSREGLAPRRPAEEPEDEAV